MQALKLASVAAMLAAAQISTNSEGPAIGKTLHLVELATLTLESGGHGATVQALKLATVAAMLAAVKVEALKLAATQIRRSNW